MQFFKSALSLSALLMLASALSVERNVPSSGEVQAMPHVIATNVKASSFGISATGCDAEDEADCKEFCHLSAQTATCSANGNKVTCSCKGGKAPESNCEERCLLCMPGKSALEEAKALFKLGKSKIDEL